MHKKDVFIVDAARTPIGKYGGALKDVRPDDMAAGVLKELVRRNFDDKGINIIVSFIPICLLDALENRFLYFNATVETY